MVVRSIHDCNFSVSIADPALTDTPLIAVSEGFCELTGYERSAVVGQNCRFLNEGCELRSADREGLRIASGTGRHFCALLENVKADGTRFLNLLDVRGLSVGQTASGEERWFVVGIQADMTECGTLDVPLEHKLQMQHIASVIRDEIASQLQATAIVSAEGSSDVAAMLGEVTPYLEPRWMFGEVAELPVLGG
mmetsp:Transcript_50791/g.104476  ORF Transcript_50791/g.104476 Transcript_50791/m.104476 type:complete len:193 (+) Transcript_50791:2-580(+)